MSLPDFFIIGAAKSGTTTLWAILDQHPEIFFPRIKEPNHFAFVGAELPEPGPLEPDLMYELLYSYCITDFEEYRALFDSAGAAQRVGEASVRYLYSPKAAERIHAAVPAARLIVMLRDPVARLYSHYCMNRRYGLEPLRLMDAVAAEPERRDSGWGFDWHYVAVSRYAHQLRDYLQIFPREQIGFFLFDDLVADPLVLFQQVCEFIGVDSSFIPDVSDRKKAAYLPRSVTLDRLLNPPGRDRTFLKSRAYRMMKPALLRLDQLNRRPVPKLSADHRMELRTFFVDDLGRLEDLLDRKLPW